MKRGMKPPHPGETVMILVLEDKDLTITEAAKLLGVSRKQLSEVCNGIASITPEMAVRIEKVFGTSAEFWLNLQSDYGLWNVRHSGKLDHLKRYSWKKATDKESGTVKEPAKKAPKKAISKVSKKVLQTA